MVSLDILSQIDHLFDDVSDNDVQSSDHGDEGQQNEPSSPAEGDKTVSDSPSDNSELVKNNPKNTESTEGSGEQEENTDAPEEETEDTEDPLTLERIVTETQTEEKDSAFSIIDGIGIDDAVLVILLGIVVILLAGAVIILTRLRRRSGRDADMVYYDEPEEEIHTMKPTQATQNSVKLADIYNGCPYLVGTVHDVGRRSNQQDSFGFSDLCDKASIESKGLLAVVADGMGGLSDGERMSQMVVVNMLEGFDTSVGNIPDASMLLKLVDRAKNAVNEDLGPDKIGKCGSTVVAVIVKDNHLSYISVGDSHIYVWREGKLIKINKDHNYAMELDELARRGEISEEEARSNPQRAALTSYIGMGELELIDQNLNPIELKPEDRILLMSDGVYGTVSEEDLCSYMSLPLLQSCTLIDNAIQNANKRNQDNYTCVIIRIG